MGLKTLDASDTEMYTAKQYKTKRKDTAMKVLVVQDEEGTLRPQAGIWAAETEMQKEAAKANSEAYLNKPQSRGLKVVEAELI